jgi:hypothetical protein
VAPDEVAHVVRLRVAAELADDRASLDRLAAAIATLCAPAADERGEWMRSLALAFEVERYYTAVESMLVRALRAVDGDLPTGPGSHQEILRAASVAIDGIRPALLGAESAALLRELLKFRHLARHGYEIDPELARMVEHAGRVAQLQPVLTRDWVAFEVWLKT